MKHWFIMTLLLANLQGAAFAVGEDHDEYSLELKGYSRETNDIVQIQVNRLEGRYPMSPPTITEQLKYNILNNQWADSLQPFGLDPTRPPRFPKRP